MMACPEKYINIYAVTRIDLDASRSRCNFVHDFDIYGYLSNCGQIDLHARAVMCCGWCSGINV